MPNAPAELRPTGENAGNTPQSLRCGPSAYLPIPPPTLLRSFLTPSPVSVHGLVTRLVSTSPLVSLAHWKPARRRLPSHGALGPRFPTFPVLCDATTATCPSRVLAGRSCPDTLRASLRLWSPRRARCLVEAPDRQGLWSPGPPVRAYRKEPGGSPKFPRSPCEDMPRSQTPVASCARAKAHPGLRPSSHWKPSAHHDSTHFGAPSRGLPPRYTRLRTAPYGEARGVATDLLARL